jgi:hypothetical protein
MKITHAESASSGNRTPEYVAWTNMIQRCTNPGVRFFERYGGRGITVAGEWRGERGYQTFLAHVGRRPSAGHSLDRYPDSDGNYEPGNVRWATETEQQRNRCSNRNITANGETRCLNEWAEITGIKRETLAQRLNSGITPEEAMAMPVGPTVYPFEGQMLTAHAIASRLGIPCNSFNRRLKRHGTVTEAIDAWRKNGKGKKPARSSP